MFYRLRYLLTVGFVALIAMLSLQSCDSIYRENLLITPANASTTNTSAASNSTSASSTNTGSVAIQSCDLPPFQYFDRGEVEGLNPEHISLLNWNIYKGNGDGWQQDLSAFAKEHDLMTIQEATTDAELTSILEQSDFNWVMNTAFYFNGTGAGVMNVAKSEAVHSCGFKIKEPLIRVPKSVLISYYAINGSDEKLLVANIHGINFTLGLDSYREQLDAMYHAVVSHDGPMIVAGDFNSWSDERMQEVDKVVSKLSLSRLEYPVNNKTHLFGNAIDHVFYRQLELVSNQVMQVSSSDHNPISVNFRYQ